MGKNNATHYEGQELVEHDCGRTIRLHPKWTTERPVYCGNCNEMFVHEGR